MSLSQIHFKTIFLALAIAAFSAINPPQQAVAASPGEYQIKAAMLFNMMRFVDWPESAFPSDGDTIEICTVSRGAMSSAADALRGKQIKGKTVLVKHTGRSGSFSGCHIILLGDTDRQSVVAILEQTRSAPVITVGENRGFAASGGVFGFMILEGKVRFEINLASAQRHRIRISSQLLKLAQNVLE